MKEPVDHIVRSLLPWRGDSGSVTECGLPADEIRTITREEYAQRIKDMGPQRAALFTCMTCSQSAGRWQTWEQDPRSAMGREVEWERGTAYWHARETRGQRLRDELTAIASLIEAHREEFDGLVEAQEARRDWLGKKDAMAKRPASKPRAI